MSAPKVKPDDAVTESLAQLGASLAARPYARRGVPMSNETIRVLLADDHAMVREGLRLLLRTAPDITVIGEAENGVTALSLAERLSPHIVILDLDMPGGDGMGALKEMGKSVPAVKVLVLTMHAERERLLPLLEAGARGYLTKEAASRDLVEAIRVVASGEVYVRPSAARLLATALVPQRAASSAAVCCRTASVAASEGSSAREAMTQVTRRPASGSPASRMASRAPWPRPNITPMRRLRSFRSR